MLEKEEEAPSDDLLGPSTDSAKNGETIPQPKGDGEEAKGKEENDGDDEEEGEEEDEGNGDENNEEVHEEEATDLEVAWEVLDVSCRSVFLYLIFIVYRCPVSFSKRLMMQKMILFYLRCAIHSVHWFFLAL